jgi:hypothetical protein
MLNKKKYNLDWLIPKYIKDTSSLKFKLAQPFQGSLLSGGC